MKYLLDKEEYDELRRKADAAPNISLQELKEICQKACDHIPVNWGRGAQN